MSTIELSAPLTGVSDLTFPKKFISFFYAYDMAMDLGTANTLVYVKNRGIVVNQPSMVALDERTNKVVAVGHAAKEMFGKSPRGVRCIRPMKDGVIVDFHVTALMIQQFLALAAKRFSFIKPRIVIGVPSGITQVEKRAVIDAALLSGVREVLLAEEPMAAALGTGLPVDRAVANMIVDIGGGTTEVAILSCSQTLYSHSIRVAGDEMDEAIQRHLRKECSVEVGILEAERIKLVIGSALASERPRSMTIFGRDLATSLPRKVEISEEAVREALGEPISAIVSSVITALEQISPDVAQDVMARGIYLAGGSSLLRGLAERLHRETGIPFVLAQDPLSCVVRGVGKIIDNLNDMRVLCIS